MFDDLKGKKILVTGSTAGIGLEVARALAKVGAKVVIHGSRSADAASSILEQFDESCQVAYFQADVRNTQDCQKLVEASASYLGGIDVLINNAGGLGGRKGLENIDDELFDLVMDLNVRSVVMIVKYALPYLRKSAELSGETSCVISTGSIAAREGGGLGASLYGGSKSMVHSLHRNWVKEFTKENIRFNIVAPGTIDTAFHSDKNQNTRDTISGTIAMQRFGRPEEVASTYVFLASHALSGYITGQIFDVNGGQLCP